MSIMLTILLKAVTGIGMKLLSEKLVMELIVWAMGKLVKSTKNKWDDELYDLAKSELD